MQLFDTHCHIDLDDFSMDRGQVLDDAREAGVTDILVPAVERANWSSLVELCAEDKGLHAALGMHPVYLHRHRSQDIQALADEVARVRPVAIGEIGLDWQRRELDRTGQQGLLEAQLEVAESYDLPVVLHVRKAHDPMLNTLKRFRLPGGFCHAFNGSPQQAARYIGLGFGLGFGGMLTFERSKHLRRLAVDLPLEALVLETDAPDMTVASHQYGRNSPAYLPEVLTHLAALRGMQEDEVADQTSANARSILGL